MKLRLDIPVFLAGLLVAGAFPGATEPGAGGGGKSCRCIGLNPTCAGLEASRSQLVPRWCRPRLEPRAGEGQVEMEVRVLEAKGIESGTARKEFEKHDGTLRQCYLEGHRAHRFPKGRLSARLHSKKSGCVDSVTIADSRLPDARTRKCLKETLYGFTLAECYAGDKPIQVKVEFRFQVVPAKKTSPADKPATP